MTTYFRSPDHIHFLTFCTFSVVSTNHSMCYEEVCQARTGHVNDTEAALDPKWRAEHKMATWAALGAAPHGKGQVTLAIFPRRPCGDRTLNYFGSGKFCTFYPQDFLKF